MFSNSGSLLRLQSRHPPKAPLGLEDVPLRQLTHMDCWQETSIHAKGASLRLLATLTAWRLAYPRPNPREGARQAPQRKPRKSHATSSAISYWLHESIQLSMEETTHRQEHQEAGIAEPTLEAGYHRRHPTAELRGPREVKLPSSSHGVSCQLGI